MLLRTEGEPSRIYVDRSNVNVPDRLSSSLGKSSRHSHLGLLNFPEKSQSNRYWIPGEKSCPGVTSRPQFEEMPGFPGSQRLFSSSYTYKGPTVATILENPRTRIKGGFLVPPYTSTTRAFSTSALLTLLRGREGGCPAHYRMFSSIPGPQPLDASSTHSPL